MIRKKDEECNWRGLDCFLNLISSIYFVFIMLKTRIVPVVQRAYAIVNIN